jgi:large subunit ribosomal protein L15
MPMQRRMPKSGFRSQKALLTTEVRLGDLNKMDAEIVDLISLKDAGLINKNILFVKIILAGELNDKKVLVVRGVGVTAGARKIIEAMGGKVEG